MEDSGVRHQLKSAAKNSVHGVGEGIGIPFLLRIGVHTEYIPWYRNISTSHGVIPYSVCSPHGVSPLSIDIKHPGLLYE